MPKFRKKPVVIEATQWTGGGPVDGMVPDPDSPSLYSVQTVEGLSRVLALVRWVAQNVSLGAPRNAALATSNAAIGSAGAPGQGGTVNTADTMGLVRETLRALRDSDVATVILMRDAGRALDALTSLDLAADEGLVEAVAKSLAVDFSDVSGDDMGPGERAAYGDNARTILKVITRILTGGTGA